MGNVARLIKKLIVTSIFLIGMVCIISTGGGGGGNSEPPASEMPSCSDLSYNYSLDGTYTHYPNDEFQNSGILSVTETASNMPLCCGPGEKQWSVVTFVHEFEMSWINGDIMEWTRENGSNGDIVGVWNGQNHNGDDTSVIFSPEGACRICSNCVSQVNNLLVIQGQICGTLIDIDEPNACTEYNPPNYQFRAKYNNQVFTLELRSTWVLESGKVYDIQDGKVELEIRERDEGTIIKSCHGQEDIEADSGTVTIDIVNNTRFKGSFNAIFNGEHLAGAFDDRF